MLILILVAVAAGSLLYLLPTLVAFCRRHPNRWLIAAINSVFGLTALGWYLALREALKPLPQAQLKALPEAQMMTIAPIGQNRVPPPLRQPQAPRIQPQPVHRRKRMGFFASIGSCFRKYATFSGRAPRSEFWYFVLFLFLLALPAAPFGAFGVLLFVPVLLPAISVEVRRLHDIDRSGWWVWLCLLPPINLVVKLIWLTRKGTSGDNRFGPDPLSGDEANTFRIPTTVSVTDKAEQLAKIKALLQGGTINQEEFERMKAEVLAS